MIYLVSQAGNAVVLLVKALAPGHATTVARYRWRGLGMDYGGLITAREVKDLAPDGSEGPGLVAQFNCPLGLVDWREGEDNG